MQAFLIQLSCQCFVCCVTLIKSYESRFEKKNITFSELDHLKTGFSNILKGLEIYLKRLVKVKSSFI